MRKGYWKILLRRLRGRVASGHDTFHRASHQSLAITEVLASSDEPLDAPAELALAATAEGPTFFIDTATNRVTLRAESAGASESTGLDLPGFIDALCLGARGARGIAICNDDADILEWQAPPPNSSLD
jgi:hypothetical protein